MRMKERSVGDVLGHSVLLLAEGLVEKHCESVDFIGRMCLNGAAQELH